MKGQEGLGLPLHHLRLDVVDFFFVVKVDNLVVVIEDYMVNELENKRDKTPTTSEVTKVN